MSTQDTGSKSTVTESKKETTKNPTFSELVSRFGVRRDVAAGLKVKCKLSTDERISEENFIKALKTVTAATAK